MNLSDEEVKPGFWLEDEGGHTQRTREHLLDTENSHQLTTSKEMRTLVQIATGNLILPTR